MDERQTVKITLPPAPPGVLRRNIYRSIWVDVYPWWLPSRIRRYLPRRFVARFRRTGMRNYFIGTVEG